MLKINYNLTIAQWSIDSADDPRTEFIALETNQSLLSPNDVCRISVYAPQPPRSELPERAAGAAAAETGLGGEEAPVSVQVRGNEIEPGDPMAIRSTAGDVSDTVMTAEVQSFHSTLEQTKITGGTGMGKLSNTRINQVYENQNLGQIVADLAGQAGVDVGSVDAGGDYPCFVMHESKSVLQTCRELAMRDGLDFYFDADNRLTMAAFSKTGADHTFFYGVDILDLQLLHHQTPCDRVRVYGESPSSNQGADAWHWIAKDITPFQSEAGDDGRTLAIQDGALKTKDAADRLAAAKFSAMKDQSRRGRLKILGNPNVKLAEAIEIKDAPGNELNGLFKVTSVRHVLNKKEGYLTYIGFTG